MSNMIDVTTASLEARTKYAIRDLDLRNMTQPISHSGSSQFVQVSAACVHAAMRVGPCAEPIVFRYLSLIFRYAMCMLKASYFPMVQTVDEIRCPSACGVNPSDRPLAKII